MTQDHRHPGHHRHGAASGTSGAAIWLEFDVIGAVVVGGTSCFGERGTMLGVLFTAPWSLAWY